MNYEECIALMAQCDFTLPDADMGIVNSISNELRELSLQAASNASNSKTNSAFSATKHSTNHYTKKEGKPSWRNPAIKRKDTNSRGPSSSAGSQQNQRKSESVSVKEKGDELKSDWRASSSTTKKKSSFTKQINLILNSAVETNADTIVDRIIKLLEDETESNSNDNYQKICEQIVTNAFAQPFYSETYVSIVQALARMDAFDVWNFVLQKCLAMAERVLSGKQTNRHEIKGFGPFMAHAYRLTAVDDVTMTGILSSFMVAINTEDSTTVRDYLL